MSTEPGKRVRELVARMRALTASVARRNRKIAELRRERAGQNEPVRCCITCGVVITASTTEMHNRWHERLSRMSQDNAPIPPPHSWEHWLESQRWTLLEEEGVYTLGLITPTWGGGGTVVRLTVVDASSGVEVDVD